MIDALTLATRLEKAGMPHGQATETAAAIRDSLKDDYATVQDLESLKVELRADLRSLEGRLDGRFQSAESKLEAKIFDAQTSMVKWFAGMMVVQVGVIVGLLRLL